MNASLPAPEFFSGIKSVKQHNDLGQTAYLFGRISPTGFWSYYPVALALKTPIGYLVLLSVGTWISLTLGKRDARLAQPLFFSAGILMFSVFYSRINIGIRHVLPVYLGFSIVAAVGLLALIQTKWKFLGLTLAAWTIISSVLAHPNYLGYFNEIAGNKPEAILIDSDLDWGQDMKRLAERLHELQIQSFSYLPLVSMQLSSTPFPAVREMDIVHPTPGWHAAHITALKLREQELHSQSPNLQFWPDSVAPIERIGRGILLWHLEDAH